jgi:hypothetical protein
MLAERFSAEAAKKRKICWPVMHNETYRKVEEHVLKVSLAQHLGIAITPETEIYRDLKMYGDDLFDLVSWAHREFGVHGSFRLSDYAPLESPFKMLWDFLRKLIGKRERQYKSLTVQDVVDAIEAKRWPE